MTGRLFEIAYRLSAMGAAADFTQTKREEVMSKVQIFDKAMCCSTGVCGPQVDSVLPRFAADLDWLKHPGHEVQRFNLAQAPA